VLFEPAASIPELGGRVIASAIMLSPEPMELGRCEEEPFAGEPSWSERIIGLRDRIGPFRLAHLEAILRAADMRASQKAAP
jgi:CRISPR-associated endonuclease/helicase Cas3